MEEFEENIPLKSKYNSALAQLYRLDNLFQKANEYSSKGQLNSWNWTLDTIWRELSPDSDKEHEKKMLSYNKLVIEHRSKTTLYQVLQFKEIFLRKLQNKQGKGSSYIDPDEDSLGE